MKKYSLALGVQGKSIYTHKQEKENDDD